MTGTHFSGGTSSEVDETTALINPPTCASEETPNSTSSETTDGRSRTSRSIIWAVLPTLLLGVFIAQADSSIVLATSQEIASHFDALSGASWLITSYVLARCACQPLYGKTSDIFGRRPLLVISYILFCLGCVFCGVGSEYWHVIAGRAISGIGGAGMVGLVAIIIADILPPREVAAWRSYVNVIATLGRSCGGPAGGWLVDNLGWRWCFLAQCPVAGVAIMLILWRLPSSSDCSSRSMKERLSRVDFIGFVTLPSALVTAFMAIDCAGKLRPWYNIMPFVAVSILLFGIFYMVEKYYASDPMIPMHLISRRDVIIPYLLIGLQTAAQFIITYTIPIYFQIVTGVSATSAGGRIVIIVVGNTLGGLISGWAISRTGTYKALIFIATGLGNVCYALVLFRWHGVSSLFDTSYLILGGLGMGSTQSTTFVHLAASLEAKDIAVAGTTWYLAQGVGMLVSASLFDLLHSITLSHTLEQSLKGMGNKKEIIDGASSSIDYIKSLPTGLQTRIRSAYVKSLIPTHALALVCGVLAFICVFFIREKKLDRK